ncbi:MAG: hypothetical protein HY393_02575 [Candidatus Diapherotrites archaeon]|nr:hypothetical protein [Candidatus Diapherotrites archaeon]
MVEPRVLVGCPTFQGKAYCLNEYLEGLESLTCQNAEVYLVDNSKTGEYARLLEEKARDWSDRTGKKFGVHRMAENVEPVRRRIVDCRNFLREKALHEGFEYFLSLEQDVIPPANAIEQLLACKKGLCSALYLNELQGPGQLRAVAFQQRGVDNKGEPLIASLRLVDCLPGRLMEVSHTGLGCMLISCSVLEKTCFRFEEGKPAWDDIFFCMDATRAGFPVFLNSQVACMHWFNESFYRTVKGNA